MQTPSVPDPLKPAAGLSSGLVVRFGQVFFVFVLQATLLFVGAGTAGWVWAWVFLGICILSVMVNASFMLLTNPETVAERGRSKDERGVDTIIGLLWALMLFVLVPFVAGLDARFGWTGILPPAWNVAGALVLAGGLGLSGWAMVTNAYFSTAVRIQTDRGQTVCTTGPYQFVRHPGYTGFLLQSLGTPVLLGSWWAMIPAVIGALFMIIRTALEDQLLHTELPGYPEYAGRVHYRLVPGLW
jgi:protein-S-isoprenylcysteine O-methyltransferase Ste14